jgi:hypothetical protein
MACQLLWLQVSVPEGVYKVICVACGRISSPPLYDARHMKMGVESIPEIFIISPLDRWMI